MKNIIYVVITTKNRINFLEKAILSVKNQTFKDYNFIVTSDSNKQNQKIEQELSNKYNFKYLINKNRRNLSSNANNAINYIVQENYKNENFNDIFLAFLDDDDTWEKEYLEETISNIDDYDLLVSGLKYKIDEKIIFLDIPTTLNEKSFLVKNPHIQGSNTFIRLKTALEAGCYDENLYATTDRDFFTRVFMLKPKYKIINKYLVNIDASNKRGRITNSKYKIDSLKIFFQKYYSMMNDFERKKFVENIEEKFGKFNFKLEGKNFQNNKVIVEKNNNLVLNKNIVIATICSSEKFEKRIVQNFKKIEKLKYNGGGFKAFYF